MFRIQAPILVVPTVEARKALDRRLRWAGLAAYREIAVAAKGLEIAHLQFAFFELTLAVCSRVRRDGVVEIEIGLGNGRTPCERYQNITAFDLAHEFSRSNEFENSGHPGGIGSGAALAGIKRWYVKSGRIGPTGAGDGLPTLWPVKKVGAQESLGSHVVGGPSIVGASSRDPDQGGRRDALAVPGNGQRINSGFVSFT